MKIYQAFYDGEDDDMVLVGLEEVATAPLSFENRDTAATMVRSTPLAGGIDEESA